MVVKNDKLRQALVRAQECVFQLDAVMECRITPSVTPVQQDASADGALRMFDELFVHYNDALSLVASEIQVRRNNCTKRQ